MASWKRSRIFGVTVLFVVSFVTCLNIAYGKAGNSSSEPVAQTQQELIREWEDEALADVDKVYTIYVGMPKSELDVNFANTGWKKTEGRFPTGTPCVKLSKGKKEIRVWHDGNGNALGYVVTFYTDYRITAVTMYNKAKEYFERHLDPENRGKYNSPNSVVWYDYVAHKGIEIYFSKESEWSVKHFGKAPGKYSVKIYRKYMRKQGKIHRYSCDAFD